MLEVSWVTEAFVSALVNEVPIKLRGDTGVEGRSGLDRFASDNHRQCTALNGQALKVIGCLIRRRIFTTTRPRHGVPRLSTPSSEPRNSSTVAMHSALVFLTLIRQSKSLRQLRSSESRRKSGRIRRRVTLSSCSDWDLEFRCRRCTTATAHLQQDSLHGVPLSAATRPRRGGQEILQNGS